MMMRYTNLKKTLKRLIVLMLAAFMLAGLCSCENDTAGEVKDSGDMIKPKALSEQTSAITHQTAKLYVPDPGFKDAQVSIQSVAILPSENVYSAVVRTLLSIISSQNTDISLLSFAFTGDIANVNLSCDANEIGEHGVFTLAYCLTNTLTEFSDVEYVNLLIDDRAVSFGGIPYGAMSRFEDELATEYWRMTINYAEISAGSVHQYDHNAAFYYGALSDPLLLGEVRQISYSNLDSALTSIIEELAKGPRDTASMTRLLPSGAYLARYNSFDTENGKVLSLYISGDIDDFSDRNDIDKELIRASVAMSVFDYYPDCCQVSVFFDEDTAEKGSNLHRTEFELLLGSKLTMYYPLLDDSKIARIDAVVPAYQDADPQILIDGLFDEPSQESGVLAIFPGDISAEDILSINIFDGEAVVDISQKLLLSLREMDATYERNTVFCIVNTLCRSMDVGSVTFLVNGEPCGNVSGRLNLSEPLMFNPGIVK